MPRSVDLEPCGLLASEAADFVGMKRPAFDEAWKAERAPVPSRVNAHPRWSKDELRAWMAHGCPVAVRWAPIWRKMLEAGTWAPSVVSHTVVRQEATGAA